MKTCPALSIFSLAARAPRRVRWCSRVAGVLAAMLGLPVPAAPSPAAPALVAATPAALPVVVIYADDNYPPYSFVEHGQLTGIYTLIVQKVIERLPEYQVQLVPVPWNRGLLLLEKGQAFALYPPYSRPAERPYMKYSEPMLGEQVAVFCNADVIARRSLKSWPDDYAGLRIGMNTGFLVGGKQFEDAVQAGRISVDAAHGSRANLLKLMRGRTDCYLNDRLSIQWELGRMRKEGLLDPTYLRLAETAELSTEQGYLGYTELAPALFPFRQDFIQKFNAAIRDLKRSGEIDEAIGHFLGK